VYIGGNDETGPSESNMVDNNAFSSNELAGGVADGSGSPESWNRAGTANQGVEGEVFFQSDKNVTLSGGSSGSVVPDGSDPDGCSFCAEILTPADQPTPGSLTQAGPAYSGVTSYLAAAGGICSSGGNGLPVDTTSNSGPLYVCTDGLGDLFLFGGSATPITQGSLNATGSSTSSEPGCEASPQSGTGSPCTGTLMTIPDLPFVSSVAVSNTFNQNVWANETLAGAIDGSGPYGEAPPANSATYVDGNPDNPSGLQNTWTNNTGSPSNSACNPQTGPIATTQPETPPWLGPECGV